MKTRIIGQIGCGAWGKNILRDLLSLRCEVIVADPSPSARETAVKLGAVRALASSYELAAFPCDGYVVASPVLTLADESEKMLRLGKPVLCEKPVLRTEEERERLAAAGAGDRLFAMYKFCYHPAVEALRTMMVSGELGVLESISLERMGWDANLQGTNCLWWAGVHQVSIAHHLLGRIPEPQSAAFVRHDGAAVAATVRLGQEAPVLLNVSCRHPKKSLSVTVSFSKGVALMPDPYCKSVTIRKDGEKTQEKAIDSTLPLLSELEDFVEYLDGGSKPRCGFDMACRISSTIRRIESLALP